MGWIAQVPARQIPFEMDSVSLSNAQQALIESRLLAYKPHFLMNMIVRFFVKSLLRVLYFSNII